MDIQYMQQAIDLAKNAGRDCPIGCVIVMHSRVLAAEHNQVELLNDPTAHAEILAIRNACKHLNSKYLNDCTLYVTLEPCLMCSKAIELAKVGRVIFGAFRDTYSYSNFIGGILQDECSQLLKAFFSRVRIKE